MGNTSFSVRVAQPADDIAVTAVLSSAYPVLLASDYHPAVLAATLPAMIHANPHLLASGTYYVQEAADEGIVSCGGWTRQEPGTSKVHAGIAHLRHFATHVDWLGKGLAAGIFERCRQDARVAGLNTFMCFATLGAERFYAKLGFHVVERTDIILGGNLTLPSITMVRTE